MEYALSNDSISIKVSTAGGSFTSIEAGGREYLWQGDPAVWSGQAPVCFPICGGLRDGSAMTFAGHHVKLARHGFARKQEWKLLSQSENELAMCLASEDNAALLSDYPYPFKLVARYTLEDTAVRVSYEVTNEGTEDMPFFIGGHPGFRCPLDEGEAYTDYELRFEKDEAAELCTAVPSTGLIDVANRSKNPMVGKTLPLSHELFDFAETIFDVLESRQVTLSKKGEDKGVRLSLRAFRTSSCGVSPRAILWQLSLGAAFRPVPMRMTCLSTSAAALSPSLRRPSFARSRLRFCNSVLSTRIARHKEPAR